MYLAVNATSSHETPHVTLILRPLTPALGDLLESLKRALLAARAEADVDAVTMRDLEVVFLDDSDDTLGIQEQLYEHEYFVISGDHHVPIETHPQRCRMIQSTITCRAAIDGDIYVDWTAAHPPRIKRVFQRVGPTGMGTAAAVEYLRAPSTCVESRRPGGCSVKRQYDHEWLTFCS